jgi:hypothetical protein
MINRLSADYREKIEWVAIRRLAHRVQAVRDQVLADRRFPGQVRISRSQQQEAKTGQPNQI